MNKKLLLTITLFVSTQAIFGAAGGERNDPRRQCMSVEEAFLLDELSKVESTKEAAERLEAFNNLLESGNEELRKFKLETEQLAEEAKTPVQPLKKEKGKKERATKPRIERPKKFDGGNVSKIKDLNKLERYIKDTEESFSKWKSEVRGKPEPKPYQAVKQSRIDVKRRIGFLGNKEAKRTAAATKAADETIEGLLLDAISEEMRMAGEEYYKEEERKKQEKQDAEEEKRKERRRERLAAEREEREIQESHAKIEQVKRAFLEADPNSQTALDLIMSLSPEDLSNENQRLKELEAAANTMSGAFEGLAGQLASLFPKVLDEDHPVYGEEDHLLGDNVKDVLTVGGDSPRVEKKLAAGDSDDDESSDDGSDKGGPAAE